MRNSPGGMKQGDDDDDGGSGVREVLMDLIKKKSDHEICIDRDAYRYPRA